MLNHQIILQQMIEDDQSNILHVIEWQPKKDEILVFLLLPEEYNRLLYMVILKETVIDHILVKLIGQIVNSKNIISIIVFIIILLFSVNLFSFTFPPLYSSLPSTVFSTFPSLLASVSLLLFVFLLFSSSPPPSSHLHFLLFFFPSTFPSFFSFLKIGVGTIAAAWDCFLLHSSHFSPLPLLFVLLP